LPVLVSKYSFHSVYRQHTFDVVAAIDMVPLMSRPGAFFRNLRPSIREGTGRLWVVNMRIEPDFTPLEFGDFAAVAEHVKVERERSPIVKRLSPEVRKAVAAAQGGAVPEYVQARFVADLNRLLEDRTLWPEARSLDESLKPSEKKVRERINEKLEKAGVFAEAGPELPWGIRTGLRLLNRLVLQDLLKSKDWERAFALDNLLWGQWKGFLGIMDLPPDGMVRLFRDSGYELIKEHDAGGYYTALEFKRAE
jgi:hypothetical protein